MYTQTCSANNNTVTPLCFDVNFHVLPFIYLLNIFFIQKYRILYPIICMKFDCLSKVLR